MRNEVALQRRGRRTVLVAALVIASPLALATSPSSAEGLFDFFFGGAKPQIRPAPPQASVFGDPFGSNLRPQLLPPRSLIVGSGQVFCVRSCDGKYFPLMPAVASPAQMCQAFCPASPTRVFFGSSIDGAYAHNGERYADSENAFAYRKALRADCTCNGRDGAGLAPIDLTLDPSLRPGDVVATTEGLVIYSWVRIGDDQTAEFTPVAFYPGLTAELRARLGEMKVAPVRADRLANDTPPLVTPPSAAGAGPNTVPLWDKRADAALPR